MTRARVAAALAVIITALLLQATLVTPLAPDLGFSLPALLVAAVALVEGPGTGVAFGFSTGLMADLASTHPAGVLALVWLGLGAVLGLAADRRSRWGDALYAGAGCGLACLLATLLLIAVHGDGATLDQLPRALAVALVSVPVALVVLPLVRAALRSHVLEAPRSLAGPHLGAERLRG